MVRAFIPILGLALLVGEVQSPADEREGAVEAQQKARIDAAQAEIERLQREIAELERKRAESLRRIKALEASIVEIRGTKAASKPPLLFSPAIERAMLHDARPRLPREFRLNPYDLPRHLPPAAPRR